MISTTSFVSHVQYILPHKRWTQRLTNQSFSFCIATMHPDRTEIPRLKVTSCIVSVVSAAIQRREGILCSFIVLIWWRVLEPPLLLNPLFLSSRFTKVKGARICPSCFLLWGWICCTKIMSGNTSRLCRTSMGWGGCIHVKMTLWGWDVVTLCAWIRKLITYEIQT